MNIPNSFRALLLKFKSAFPAQNEKTQRMADFYVAFEDKFRGSEQMIQKRLEEYVPVIKSLGPRLQTMPMIDLGCGRGEFLELLKEQGYQGIGVDTDASMLRRADAKGLSVRHIDGIRYLRSQNDNSLALITGFHLVEHLPFEALMQLFTEGYRCLAPGGMVIFETPNPETVSVGANTFYLDPSHRHPIPPQLLTFMLEFTGFETETRYLHTIETTPADIDPAIQKIHTAFFGPADYAIIGKKPTSSTSSS